MPAMDSILNLELKNIQSRKLSRIQKKSPELHAASLQQAPGSIFDQGTYLFNSFWFWFQNKQKFAALFSVLFSVLARRTLEMLSRTKWREAVWIGHVKIRVNGFAVVDWEIRF